MLAHWLPQNYRSEYRDSVSDEYLFKLLEQFDQQDDIENFAELQMEHSEYIQSLEKSELKIDLCQQTKHRRKDLCKKLCDNPLECHKHFHEVNELGNVEFNLLMAVIMQKDDMKIRFRNFLAVLIKEATTLQTQEYLNIKDVIFQYLSVQPNKTKLSRCIEGLEAEYFLCKLIIPSNKLTDLYDSKSDEREMPRHNFTTSKILASNIRKQLSENEPAICSKSVHSNLNFSDIESIINTHNMEKTRFYSLGISANSLFLASIRADGNPLRFQLCKYSFLFVFSFESKDFIYYPKTDDRILKPYYPYDANGEYQEKEKYLYCRLHTSYLEYLKLGGAMEFILYIVKYCNLLSGSTGSAIYYMYSSCRKGCQQYTSAHTNEKCDGKIKKFLYVYDNEYKVCDVTFCDFVQIIASNIFSSGLKSNQSDLLKNGIDISKDVHEAVEAIMQYCFGIVSITKSSVFNNKYAARLYPSFFFQKAPSAVKTLTINLTGFEIAENKHNTNHDTHMPDLYIRKTKQGPYTTLESYLKENPEVKEIIVRANGPSMLIITYPFPLSQ